MKGKKHTDETKQKIKNKRKNQKNNYFSLPERNINSVLSLNGIGYQKHKAFKIDDSWHQVDMFIEPNIVVEVDGCYYHWCEECMRNKTLNRNDIKHIWEHEINNNIMECLNKIRGEMF